MTTAVATARFVAGGLTVAVQPAVALRIATARLAVAAVFAVALPVAA